MLRLRTFGGPSIEGDNGPISGAVGQRRPLALLALLAVSGARGMSRDKLLAYLWPESSDEQARNALRQALFRLRRDLGQPELVLGSTELRLNPSAISSDVAEFEAALERAEPERAVVLYRGPFLEGFHLNDAPDFERWMDAERRRLAERVCGALESLAKEATQRGDHEVAAGWWRRLTALEPLNGRVAVKLMEALAAAGDRAGALQHARVHEALLRQELDSGPDPAVLALSERLRQASVLSPADQSRLSAPDLPRDLPGGASAQRERAGFLAAEDLTLPAMRRMFTGRYELQRKIARGAMATVYLAQDLRHERQVALKVLHPELAAALGRERFLREIHFAARLQHPHILPLYDSGEAEGTLFYVMPYIEGESLRSQLRRERELPVPEALRIAREIADALS